MPVTPSLKTARTNLALKRIETANKLFARETARQALDDAQRAFPAGSQQVLDAQAAFLGAQGLLNAARGDETTARNTLNNGIKTWLSGTGTPPPALTPDADFARMANTGCPVALFPVRLETRFGVDSSTPPKPVLRVRIYPDEILSDMHERELLPKEVEAGQKYWELRDGNGNPVEDVDHWAEIAKEFGVPRAAYIVRATFPDAVLPPLRATSPSRAAEAVLPDRFVVLAFKGGALRHTKAGNPIPEPLTFTPDPSDDAAPLVEVADGFKVPSSVLWTVKYEEAESKGMGITIDNLSSDEVTGGFDRVMVLGVKTSMEPQDAVPFITNLIGSHHYTRGIDLVPQGTPTNNIPGRPTPFTMTDLSAAETFQIERIGPQDGGEPPFTPDFYWLADLFGFDRQFNAFRFLRESRLLLHDIHHAKNMRRALWGVTLGYFMSQMMNPEPYLFGSGTPIFTPETVTAAREFFASTVAAQGPAPAFRIGAVPYGVLPAISVSRMVPAEDENSIAVNVMAHLLSYWKSASASVSVVSRNSTRPHVDLLKVLSQKSRSDGAYVRNSIGVQTSTNLLQLVSQDFASFLDGLTKPAPSMAAALGRPEWAQARIFSLNFSQRITKHAGPLVTKSPSQGLLVSAIPPPQQFSEEDTFNYLEFLGNDKLTQIKVENQRGMLNAAPPNDLQPLLFLLARHSLLLEMVEVARRASPSSFPAQGKLDNEFWNIAPAETNTPVFDILKSTPAGFARTLFDAIKLNSKATNDQLDNTGQFDDLQRALHQLAPLPVTDLERLMMETLDLAAHRLDAFVTGLATRRLLKFRAGERAISRAPTTYYGAYGWVEDVRPTARTTRQITGLGSVDVQPNNGGYIHSPSLRHATTAAILRSGRMTEKSNASRYAIELPSKRARTARELMDGVRDGQPLGAILGSLLERGLRDAGRNKNIPQMESYILALRLLYPQVANKSGNDPGLSADRIAARNVVDGKLVRQASHAPGGGLPFGTGGLPPSVSPGADAIRAEVKKLDELMDATGDLVVSEAMYQIAAGDVVTAEAAMNFLPSGNQPPEPQVTDSPTAGIAVNHRVALVLEPPTAPPVIGWNAGTPRGSVDPFVEDWAERQLGDPTTVTVTIDYVSVGPPGGGGPVPGTTTFSIANLNVSALDFLALAQSTSVAGQRSPIDRMIETLFLEGTPGATNPVITYNTPDPPGRSIPQFVELGRALGGVLGGSRELAVADLRRAEDGINDPALGGTADDLSNQADAAIGTMEAVRDALAGPNLFQALRDASAYLADAFPDPNASDAALGAAAIGAQSELARRATEARTALDAVTGGKNADRIAGAIQALRILFGRNTLAVMPAFALEGADEIKKSLAALDRPLTLTDPSTFEPHQAPWRFLQQASRVHERLGAWRRFRMYAGAFGAAAPLTSVAQLPFVAGEEWAGRKPPVASRTSLVLVSANGQTTRPNTAQQWRGLLLDQWTEIVPSDTAETALAFHYDSQNSEAPQVILMAVHSGKAGGWKLEELHTIVNETMDLALSRPVDNDMVSLGQLDPPIVLASNSENKTVSTTIGPEARQGPPLIG